MILLTIAAHCCAKGHACKSGPLGPLAPNFLAGAPRKLAFFYTFDRKVAVAAPDVPFGASSPVTLARTLEMESLYQGASKGRKQI